MNATQILCLRHVSSHSWVISQHARAHTHTISRACVRTYVRMRGPPRPRPRRGPLTVRSRRAPQSLSHRESHSWGSHSCAFLVYCTAGRVQGLSSLCSRPQHVPHPRGSASNSPNRFAIHTGGEKRKKGPLHLSFGPFILDFFFFFFFSSAAPPHQTPNRKSHGCFRYTRETQLPFFFFLQNLPRCEQKKKRQPISVSVSGAVGG